MSARFTPGPWEVFDHYCGRDPLAAGEEYAATRLIGLSQFDTLAEVRHGNEDLPGDVDANARLIAAAPELYEALLAMIAWANSNGTGGGYPGSQAVAALAKARGEA